MRSRRFINIRLRNFRSSMRRSLFSIRRRLRRPLRRRISAFTGSIWLLGSLDKARGETRRLRRGRGSILILTVIVIVRVRLSKGLISNTINISSIICSLINNIINSIINIRNKTIKTMRSLIMDIKIDYQHIFILSFTSVIYLIYVIFI